MAERNGKECVSRGTDLHGMSHGTPVLVAGMAICRQRPGQQRVTCFISLEDETGIANLFVPKKTFQRLKGVIIAEPFLIAHGHVRISEGDQPTVYVTHIEPLSGVERQYAAGSHDFH